MLRWLLHDDLIGRAEAKQVIILLGCPNYNVHNRIEL